MKAPLREIAIVAGIALALTLGAVYLGRCSAERKARQEFIDGCKQEQPVDRCEALWEKNGEP